MDRPTAPRNDRTALLAVVALFALVNVVLLAINGVRHGGDTPQYLDGAARLLDGRPLIAREPSYSGYVALVAFAQATGVGLVGVALIQIAVASAAAASVYQIATTFAGRAGGVIATALLAVDVDTNRWHQFILADSLYASLFTMAVWLTHRAAVRGTVGVTASAAIALVGAGLVRPEGWFLIPAAVFYFIVMRTRSTRQRVAGTGALVVVAVLLTGVIGPVVSGNLQAVGPADMLRRGQTIWDFDGWRVSMPESDASAGSQASSAVTYAIRHPLSTATLMVARVGVHLAHVRPYYSRAHNVVLVAWLVPIYLLGLRGLWKQLPDAQAWWLMAALSTQTLVVALTHAEWDGRYLAHVLPLWFAFTGAGATTLLKSWTERRIA